jgi:hypothetical protein
MNPLPNRINGYVVVFRIEKAFFVVFWASTLQFLAELEPLRRPGKALL